MYLPVTFFGSQLCLCCWRLFSALASCEDGFETSLASFPQVAGILASAADAFLAPGNSAFAAAVVAGAADVAVVAAAVAAAADVVIADPVQQKPCRPNKELLVVQALCSRATYPWEHCSGWTESAPSDSKEMKQG
mmetsp:Transcript_22112/g.39694  ORF Transcript_22112/g.39694 Transcript_22112/m.39694 type:complete len:135 (+) Transcript_22112:614-1018(+)